MILWSLAMFKMFASLCLAVSVLLSAVGCSDGNNKANAQVFSYDELGPYFVGNRTISVMNAAEGRMLDVELWYPASDAGTAQVIQDFSIDEAQRGELAAFLENVPAQCTRRETSAGGATPAMATPATLPLVVFSHCFDCMRYSLFSLAERLASHGIVVAAPDHPMNTVFDSGAMITAEFLQIRASDVSAVLDELLIGNSAALPDDLQGRFDASQVGVAGHSFGAVTAGKVLQDDPRFKAGLIIAAPVESPVLAGVAVANIEEPMLFMIAKEDNSITEFGNAIMRANFEAAPSPAWKVELADAGHWSFSDIAGLAPALAPLFSAGCGEGDRQTNPGEAFTYLDNQVARDITASYGMRFFAGQLLGDEDATAALSVATVPDVVDVQAK